MAKAIKIEPTPAPKEKVRMTATVRYRPHGRRENGPDRLIALQTAVLTLKTVRNAGASFQLHHPHGLHLFQSTAIDKFFSADR
jgi:hypothetical protein